MNLQRDSFMTTYKGRLYPNYWDMVALLFVLGIILLLSWGAKQMAVPYQLGQQIQIYLDPSYLPGYALRTVMRMLIAMLFSLLFTFTFGTWAAKNPRAERVIIPIVDICQSIPILGFLSAAIVGFIALFPGSLLGPECAVIFAIFTSQAWNMVLGFYQRVKSVPNELKEAAASFHLSAWQSFWRIDVPFAMPSLLWNMMMSMSAGWFFVVASEAVSVANQQIMLPGVGSYISLAIQTENVTAIAYAILTMLIVIIIYDQLLFRPLVSWAEKFKSEQMGEERGAKPWLNNLLHRTRMLRFFGGKVNESFDRMVNVSWLLNKPQSNEHSWAKPYESWLVWGWNLLFTGAVIGIALYALYFMYRHIPFPDVFRVFYLGMATTLRVVVVVIICSLIWVPIGVWVGMRPRIAEIAQPIAQFLAAFPANLLYPLLFVLVVTFHLNVDIWVTALMILGVQWYMLFNVIAGASMLPKDLIQATDNLSVTGWLRWKRFILPGIFPYYITGAITVAGGAWNASIVAEVINWGDTKLVASGLGSYISEYTEKGDFMHMGLGICMMCIIVLLFNRLVWRPLYVLAESRFSLE